MLTKLSKKDLCHTIYVSLPVFQEIEKSKMVKFDRENLQLH